MLTAGVETYRATLHTAWIFIFQAWYLYSYLKDLDGLPSQGQGEGWILRTAYVLESYIGMDAW